MTYRCTLAFPTSDDLIVELPFRPEPGMYFVEANSASPWRVARVEWYFDSDARETRAWPVLIMVEGSCHPSQACSAHPEARTREGAAISKPEEEMIATLLEAMKRKLLSPENASKSPWRDESPSWLVERLEEEVRELADAVAKYQRSEFGSEEVIGEAADVANFCGMIIDVLTATD